MNKECKIKKGFTLAEVLITLLTIGVVAALTIPALFTKIQDTVMTKQRSTAASKIAEGFNQMRVDGALMESYTDTRAFVQAMQKYFKINQVCTGANNLKNCFPETVSSTTTQNETTTTTSDNITEMEDADKVVGVLLSDGVAMLIKYNPNGQKIAEGDTTAGKVTADKDGKTYASYGDLFYYVFDVNNNKTPNTIGKDILGNLSLSNKPKTPLEAYQAGTFKSNTFTQAQCQQAKTAGAPINECPVMVSNNGDDYWASAVNTCFSQGKRLPTVEEVMSLQENICTELKTQGAYSDKSIWTSEEYTDNWATSPGYEPAASGTHYSATIVYFYVNGDATSCGYYIKDKNSGQGFDTRTEDRAVAFCLDK